MFLALLGLSKEGFRLNDDDLSKLKEKTERALAMDGTSSSEAEEEVSVATMLGLDADASDRDGEHMVFDPSYLRDASDFVSVDVRVVEYKGRTLGILDGHHGLPEGEHPCHYLCQDPCKTFPSTYVNGWI